jgi:hypothetical protein
MSLFSKSPKDAAPKADPEALKLPATSPGRTGAQSPPSPAQAAPAERSPAAPKPLPPSAHLAVKPRPPMPAVAIGPPTAPVHSTHPAAPAAEPVPAATGAGAPVTSAAAAAPAPVAAPAPAKPPPLPLDPTAKATRATPPPVGSVRPTAPGMTETDSAHVSIADTFERLLSLEDLDEGFASIQRIGDTVGSPSVALTDLTEVRALFAQLAVNHVRQVRDFMIDLRWRDATVDWVGICEPALRSLRRAADKLELRPLCAALDQFSEALATAQSSGGHVIDGERRDRLIAHYEELSTLMPQAFALDLDRTQREAVILQSLLLQVPDVKKVTLDRLYAAGLTSLEALFLATPADLAATTGIGEALATRIVERFRTYREQVQAAVPDATRTNARDRVAKLTARLRQEHDEYERTSQSWTREADAKKKKLRTARAQTLLDIQVVLARLGEVERLKELERLPFERKVAHLESFLEEAREKYVAQA